MKKLNKKGFTIVELVIVIAVIAILASVMIPTFSGIVSKAQESAARQQATGKYHAALAYATTDNINGDDWYINSGSYWYVVDGGAIGDPVDAPENTDIFTDKAAFDAADTGVILLSTYLGLTDATAVAELAGVYYQK